MNNPAPVIPRFLLKDALHSIRMVSPSLRKGGGRGRVAKAMHNAEFSILNSQFSILNSHFSAKMVAE